MSNPPAACAVEGSYPEFECRDLVADRERTDTRDGAGGRDRDRLRGRSEGDSASGQRGWASARAVAAHSVATHAIEVRQGRGADVISDVRVGGLENVLGVRLLGTLLGGGAGAQQVRDEDGGEDADDGDDDQEFDQGEALGLTVLHNASPGA
jgi:hypothetical protein